MTAVYGQQFFVYIKGLSPSTAASWISLYYAGITVGRLLIGFVSMKISSKMLIRAGQLVALSGAILLLLPFSSSLFSLTGLILIGLGAPIYPSILHETPTALVRQTLRELWAANGISLHRKYFFLRWQALSPARLI